MAQDEENSADKESRLLPLAAATIVCFFVALTLGYGGWYLLGSHKKPANNSSETPTVKNESGATPVNNTGAIPVQPTPEPIVPAPAGEIAIPGGELTLGGGNTGLPLRREIVEPFVIGETEVTNEQYREFIQATNHAAPSNWENGDFPAGTATQPVVMVGWKDANDYCRWLGDKIKAEVRLPTEAEWMMAAGGPDKLLYPWGNRWNSRAAASGRKPGQVMAVRSYPAGKSPFGVYDMAGNVWEWTADEAPKDKIVRGDQEEHASEEKSGTEEKDTTLRVIKGGAIDEPKEMLSVVARQKVPETSTDPSLGFRYVVLRKK